MEEWRDIVGYEGLYQVSNFGRLKSLEKTSPGKNNSIRVLKEKIISPGINSCGYLTVVLRKNGKNTTMKIHRLVAFAFPEICGKWFEGAQVDHINTIRSDNMADNLRWVTRKTNSNNPLSLKHLSNSNKNNQGLSKWVIKLSKNNEILHFYPSTRQAERETGITQPHISSCCIGKRKTAGGFIWKYAE